MGPQLCRTGAGYAGGRQPQQAGTGAPRPSPQLGGEQEEQSPAPLQNIPGFTLSTSTSWRSTICPWYCCSNVCQAQHPAASSPQQSPHVQPAGAPGQPWWQRAGCALPCSTSLTPWLPRTPESQGRARRFLLLCAPPWPGDRTWGALAAPWHGGCWCRGSTVGWQSAALTAGVSVRGSALGRDLA